MTLDDLKLTVARTSVPLPNGKTLNGTAFLVSATHALTCAHCVRDFAGTGFVASVELYFSMWDEPRKQQADVQAVDQERDIALLRLSTAAAVPACPLNSNAVNEARWQAFGYPTPTAQNGIMIGGMVRDVDARAGVGERHVIQLQCDEAGDVLQGASGGPVFVNDAIVGIITNQPQMNAEPDARGTGYKPAYGALFAMSMAQIASIPSIADFVEVPPALGMAAPRPEPTPADLFQQYRQIVEAMPKLMTVKIAGSSGAIETVPLESIYVEPELSGLRTIDDIWNRRRVAVVGEEGLGKGAFLKALNLRLLRAENRGEDALWPLHVELDRYAGQTDRADLVDFALYDLLGLGGDERLREHVKSCAQQGRVVLFCDGLENVGTHYARVVEALSRQPRFIVGVRPGSRTDVGQESGGTLPLQPFDRSRIEAFIGKWANVMNRQPGSVDEARFLHDIVSQPSLLELARIPRFLGLICSVMSAGQAVVATRTALIFSAWNTVWQAALGEEKYPRRQAATRALQEMARSIFQRGASVNREFDEGELYDSLGRAGEREPDVVVARLLEHEIIAPGRDSGSASRTFRFPFDGFLEYLAAEGLANDDAFVKTLPTLPIDRRWIQILPLVTGAVARTRNPLPILRGFLNDLSALATGESLGLHVCLVAECLAEVPDDLRANLAPFPEKTAEELLRVFIDQPSTRGRMRPAIRRLQPPLLREGLENILEDREKPADQRAGAAYGLSAFTDRKAFETLAHFAQHGDEAQARGAACLGLARLGREEAVGQLVAGLRDSEQNVRLIAAQCLGRRRDRDLASMVLSAWLDSLRQSASTDFEQAVGTIIWMAAIVSVRSEATVPTLLHQLGGGGEEAAQRAAQVLAQTGTRAAVHPGIRLLESAPEDTVRQVAAETLFRLGTEAAIAALRRAIARGDQAAKLGVLSGYGIVESLRLSPAADLVADPVDVSLSWSMVAPLEMELFEAHAEANLAGLQDILAQWGRAAVLANARETMMQTNVAPRPGDMLAELAKMISGPEALKRMAAFETIQLLEPDPELLVASLFDADAAVVVRASSWLRARYSDIPIDKLLDRLDALPADSTSLAQSAALFALNRLQHLRTLIERSRNGSRSAAQALWTLSSQFGFHLYDDGRIELPDGQIETDYEKVAGRLNQFAAAAARESADTADAALALEGAKAEFRAASESRPSDGAGFACRAAIELGFGQMEQGRESIELAIEVDPTSALWVRFRGLLCRSSPYSAEAASDFELAIDLGDHSSINYVDAGDALLACGEFERAVTRFSEALEATPGQPDALFGRGLARCHLSRFKEAVEDLDLFLANTPDHKRAISLRARARAQLAPMDPGAIVGGLLQPAESGEWESLLAEARQLLAIGELDEAFTAAKRVIIAQPFHPAARVLRARVWVEQGYPDFAIGDLVDLAGRLTESAPRDALAAALDELIEIQGEDKPRPLTEIQRANGIGVRGVVLAALGVRNRALSDLERAVAGGAGQWKMLDTLAGFYIDDVEGKLDEGLRLALEALQALQALKGAMLPSDEEKAAVCFTVGRASFKKGLRDDARQVLEAAAALAPGDAAIAALLEQVKSSGG